MKNMPETIIKDQDKEDVAAFLAKNPSYKSLLEKALEKIVEVFGKEVLAFRLSVDKHFIETKKCPDCAHWRSIEGQELVIHIQVSTDAETAIQLELQYDDWFLDNLADTNLHTTTEFVA